MKQDQRSELRSYLVCIFHAKSWKDISLMEFGQHGKAAKVVHEQTGVPLSKEILESLPKDHPVFGRMGMCNLCCRKFDNYLPATDQIDTEPVSRDIELDKLLNIGKEEIDE